MKVTILGEGAWGCALATLLIRNGHDTTLWCHDALLCQDLALTHENKRYLPGYQLPVTLTFTTQLREALNAPIIIVTTPLTFLRKVLEDAQKFMSPDQVWIFGSKGMEFESFKFSHELFACFSENKNIALLSGPSFAQEVMQEKPTKVMLATQERYLYELCLQLFQSTLFKLEYTKDLRGVAAAGAYKNVAALASGLIAGFTSSENARAWFVTKAFEELKLVIRIMGGEVDSANSLAGMADLILTCYSTTSKNFRYGSARGSGLRVEEINQQFPTMPEGPNTLKALYSFQLKHNISLPLSSVLNEIFFENKNPRLLLEKM